MALTAEEAVAVSTWEWTVETCPSLAPSLWLPPPLWQLLPPRTTVSVLPASSQPGSESCLLGTSIPQCVQLCVLFCIPGRRGGEPSVGRSWQEAFTPSLLPPLHVALTGPGSVCRPPVHAQSTVAVLVSSSLRGGCLGTFAKCFLSYDGRRCFPTVAQVMAPPGPGFWTQTNLPPGHLQSLSV